MNYKCDQPAREILAEAIATDEDEVDGEAPRPLGGSASAAGLRFIRAVLTPHIVRRI